jgi:pyruvate,water dikinase
LESYVLDLGEIDQSRVDIVGGKGAHLGALSRIEGIHVPPGFCVTTHAYRRIVAQAPSVDDRLDQLSRISPANHEASSALSAEIRAIIDGITIPADLSDAIAYALTEHGQQAPYAVRSSATAEDMPNASFAGQHDSYLVVRGPASVLYHVRRCWASLFTDRAIMYRQRHGFDHRKVAMAVVVQRMLDPQAAGILFTADPVTGNRKIASIDASFGLGEALVSGRVNADVYKVRDGEVVAKTIGTKQFATRAMASGGTHDVPIVPEQQTAQALSDAQIRRLAHLGRRIEAHFGQPQDIEWCLVDNDFQFVQSRPITTLFPIPTEADSENRVYISVGHQQMMTDPMKPLGLSVWQMTTVRPMAEAGGRLFVDVTQLLATPASRPGFLQMVGKSDPLIGDALQNVIDRGDFVRPLPNAPPAVAPFAGASAAPPLPADPAIVAELVDLARVSLATSAREIDATSGTALFDFIRSDIQEMKRVQFDPKSLQLILAGMEATWWLNDHLQAWLGEKNLADTLAQSAPDNVTSEMGLALLDVADAIRPHPDVVAFLRQVTNDAFLDVLPRLDGGHDARDAIQAWLTEYGMRGAGEIDITRPRWSERPSSLVPILLSHVENFEPGEAKRRFDQGLQLAQEKEHEVLQRLRVLPDGESKAEETRRVIVRLRTFVGYREFPKYHMVSRYFIYKQALMKEADRLVQSHVLREAEDIFFLRFDELHEVVRTRHVDHELIRERKEAFSAYVALKPPRVLTSEGEGVVGNYRRENMPEGALIGLPVSSGTVEGRARVVLDIADARIEPGDILVTRYTDPSWTPLFVAVKGLVTEVGGLMTHGAVIAREYGLPAVVGVVNATQLIRDGQRIRLNGTDGYVTILGD